jgi:hypothetical protein
LSDAFRYFYRELLDEHDLSAAKIMKENYVRMAKGKANTVGHTQDSRISPTTNTHVPLKDSMSKAMQE